MLDQPDKPVSALSDVLEITTLGGLSVRSNGKLVTGFVSRKAEALLVYLACTRRQHAREILADLLWDDRSADQALHYPCQSAKAIAALYRVDPSDGWT